MLGSSTSPKIIAEVTRRVKGKKVLVILDSAHNRAHVLKELRAYAPLVNVGGYVVDQDGVINGYPLPSVTGPGSWEGRPRIHGWQCRIRDRSNARTPAGDGESRWLLEAHQASGLRFEVVGRSAFPFRSLARSRRAEPTPYPNPLGSIPLGRAFLAR